MYKYSALLFSATLAATAFASPVHLRTNSLDAPIGIDTSHPTLSWQSDAKTPNWTQSAYEILVATDAKNLKPGKADVWDSRRVSSSESVNIAYAGAALKPQQRYVWAVKTWDSKGKPTTSAPAFFETGLMSPSDWKAQWIMRKDPADETEMATIRWIWLPHVDPQKVLASSPAHFLYKLHLDAKPAAASLHILAPGRVIARVNGQVTGHHDEWSAFDQEEISGFLHVGDNEIQLDAVSRRGSRSANTSRAAVAASIHITPANGVEQRIVTDEHWLARETSEGPWAPAQAIGPMSLHFSTGTDREEAISGPDRVSTNASLLRKDFALANTVQSARLTVTALGAYQAFINGKPVAANNLLTPGWTDFRKRAQFQTYDVTSLVSKGANTIGAILGGGWYSSPMTWTAIRVTPGPNLLRAQLDLTLADGTHQTIATDSTWLTSTSPITFSEIYGGESYDARLIQKGWSSPNFNAASWTTAAVGAPFNADMVLNAQPDLPINTTITLHPIALDPANSAHPVIYDMGQNMVGNIRIHVSGPRASVIKMRFAERLNPDGSIYTENLRNADATDTYILSGEGDETYTPSFTFHGFRYVEFSGTAAPPTLATIEGLVFNNLPAKPSIRLSSSSATLNKMNELGAWGQRGNFVSIPTDCPQRDERLGWMGDAGVFWRTGSYNFDIDAFSHKFMLDVEDAQNPEGAFSDVSPNVLSLTKPGAPGWGDAGVFIPYAAWLQYGDANLVEQSWPAMERWMDFILKSNPNHLRQQALGNNYADWLAPDQNTPKDLIGTAYWALIAHEMAEMATALHRTDDAKKYQQQYDQIAAAYRAAYVKEDGSVAGNTQTSYLATVFTGIAPASLRANMVDRAVKDIEAHGTHLTTGFLGTPFLLSVLDENNRSDVAFKLLLSDTYPSWGYMVKKGATTWWERWNGDTGDPGMNSYNHYAFGSVMAWVYRRAAGIDTDTTGPGYHHLTIQPHFDAALPQLHAEYDSTYGTITTDWQQSAHKFSVTIPANTTGTVTLPNGKTENVGSGTKSWTVQ
ncbi:alpha-L-rhamnosidase [Terriglobus saanensis SP1PR4]|uniref:alpha-L-rhamnosidase n=2 Tax=Terriglobus saanensis TaxID=870903 RepID=E8V8C7_TERSS|nr:alpha-L-rhamnosidase [Terriglobus saanensis SP1PR4]